MSNVRDLPDLAGDVSARAVPPSYDEVTRRVRARRRRTAAGTLAATALVVGGLAVWQNVATSLSSGPLPPASQGPSPAPADVSWQEVLAGDDVHVWSASGSDEGSIAVAFRSLVDPQPAYALVVRGPDGEVIGRSLDEAPNSLTPVPGGWVVVLASGGGRLLGADGTWTDLGTPGSSRYSEPGDRLIPVQYHDALYSPQTRSWSWLSLNSNNGELGYLLDSGRAFSCVRRSSGRLAVVLGDHLIREVSASGCAIAGHGDDVVVVTTGDANDGSVTIRQVFTGGDSWRSWRTVTFETGSLASVAILDDGTPAVTTDAGALTLGSYRSDGLAGHRHGVAFAAGHRLYTLDLDDSMGPLSYTDDKGDTWHTAPLPGMESSED